MLIPRTDRPDQWPDFLHGNSNFVAVKARKCDRSLQTSPVWRGPNTADSADWYMAGYSPAALAASLVNLTNSFTLFMEESNLQ